MMIKDVVFFMRYLLIKKKKKKKSKLFLELRLNKQIKFDIWKITRLMTSKVNTRIC